MALASLIALIPQIRSPREVAIGALLFMAAITIAAVVGVIAMKLMPHRLAHPAPAIAAMWIVGIASTLMLTHKRSWHGRAVVWHIIAIALALALPGVSFLFLVPAMAFHARIAGLVAAILFFPLVLSLYTAVGPLGLLAGAVLMAIFASTLTAL